MNRTLIFYNKNAKQFIEQTINVDMQLLYTPFIDSLPSMSSNEQHILDLGCGSGRDSIYFANQDFNVTAIDGSQNLIELAKIHCNNNHNYYRDNIEWQCLPFAQLNEKNWHDKYTGIWACASLLHIPYLQLADFITCLLPMLKINGVIYMSFKYGHSDRRKNGRFFCDLNEERWAYIKFQLNKRFEDTVWITDDKRVGRDGRWLNILLRPSLTFA